MRLLAGRRSTTAAVGRFDVQKKERRGQRTGGLYVVAAVEDDTGETLARRIVQVVGSTFDQNRRSLTSRLIRAVQAGSALLLRHNLSLVDHPPRSGGIACAVVRGGDVFMAQSGGVVACLYHRARLTHFLPDPSTLEGQPTFGRRRDPDVKLAYHALQPGDAVLLGSESLLGSAAPTLLVDALGVADAALSLDRLAEALPHHDGVALALAVRRRGESIPGEPPSGSDETRPAPFPLREDAPPSRERDGARDLLIATRRVAGDWLRRLTPGGDEVDAEGKGPAIEADQPLPAEDLAPQQGRLWAARRGARRLLVTSARAIGDGLRRLLPASAPPRRRAGAADGSLWRWMALGLPVLVILIVAITYWKRGVDRQVRYDAIVSEVGAQLEVAATADEVQARQALETAQAAFVDVDWTDEQAQQIAALQQAVRERLDALNRVHRLDGYQTLYSYPASGAAEQIVVQGDDVYVLDRLSDRVYHHRLDETGAAFESAEADLLVRKGDRPGSAGVVGELVGMAWMSGGEGANAGSLLVLAQDGQLLAYNPAWSRLTGTMLPASETWQYPVAVSTYTGNFYILDAGTRQVLRYRRSGPGYNVEPEPYFAHDAPEVANAIDMVIDGFIYLLLQDGRIKKYLRGDAVPLTLSRLDKPLNGPTALFGAPDDQARFLYAADPSNSRLLRFDKEGRLIQQFVIEGSNVLGGVRDIFVSEVGGKLYFLSDNQLGAIDIPTP
jgi:hypothetical protein